MYSSILKRVDWLSTQCDATALAGRKVGLEKESLRVGESGKISQLDHPSVLGSALCHTAITTDFSESLLEMVTPPCDSSSSALHYLHGIHQFVASQLPVGEMLWNTSMPCIVNGEKSIRIGEYGSAHSASMKHAYRRGLGLRYGRMMQAIAGIHYNFSMPDAFWYRWAELYDLDSRDITALRTTGYFHMTRGWMRVAWVVPYLFGASPAVCETFLGEAADESDLGRLNKGTRYARYGTSLRMGNIGYRYREDSGVDLSVCHQSFNGYLTDLHGHVTTEHPAYAKQGILDKHGKHQQLNANRLQIENEFYSSIRPKQVPEGDEMPLIALRERGIRYLELRSVDINPFEPTGLTDEQLAFLEVMMVFTALMDPTPQDASAVTRAKHNVETVAHRGREPGLQLETADGPMALKEWGMHLVESLEPIAQWIDQHHGTDVYTASVAAQRQRFMSSDYTTSADVLDQVHSSGSFFRFAMDQSARHHHTLMSSEMNTELCESLMLGAAESMRKQRQLESETHGEFIDYLASRFEQLDTTMSSPLMSSVDELEAQLYNLKPRPPNG